jgi:class 3 adenylate cyclase/predicted ATPase
MSDPQHRNDPKPQSTGGDRLSLYVPRVLQQHLVDAPQDSSWKAEGSAVLIDISGFTRLSERLARKGREGAEEITEAIGASFESILLVAYENGGSLLKFGGDAMLLWFEHDGHAARASRATVLMRRALRKAGRIEVPGARATLRMAQAVHSATFDFFAVGNGHLEFLPTGEAWTRLVALEQAAHGGEILLSAQTAALLPKRCLRAHGDDAFLLVREPPGHRKLPLVARPAMPHETLARCLSPPIRDHVIAGSGSSEHRPVTIAFIRFEGTDALIEREGAERAALALSRLVAIISEATDAHQIAVLGSDVDIDGGKLILTAGAPHATGNDEERMLLALRRIVEAELPLPIRIGVHRGAVFAGDIGPFYRRTYSVMGDAVNLTARLMANAAPGGIYATEDVLERSHTLFETVELPPLSVKGKSRPVRAWSVGRAIRSRTRDGAQHELPLIGRDAERARLREALASARDRAGRVVEIVGEAGVGKTRLLEALREDAAEFRRHHAVCEAYTTAMPYALWRELLRELMNFGRDDGDDAIEARLRKEVAIHAPELECWLPLVAIPFDLALPPTPEVALLADANRRAKTHEVVTRFLEAMMPEPQFIEIGSAHHMDAASAELLSYLCHHVGSLPWLVAVSHRPTGTGFSAPESAAVARVELAPLSESDALAIAQVDSEQSPLPMHVLEVVARRSEGNPQFLRDLLRAAQMTGRAEGLPDSAEAAAIARIDALPPGDRALVRRAAIFGLTFHPRMLSWFGDEDGSAPPDADAWQRVGDLFNEEPDGYMRFRRSLLRDAAYEGLPYRVRRRLHRIVAAHLEEELDYPEESAGILSMHYAAGGDYVSAWRHATVAAGRAAGIFAYVEAAHLYMRSLESARRIEGFEERDLANVHESLGDAWNRAGDYGKAVDAFNAARRAAGGDRLMQSRLLLKRSWIEEKLGKYQQALRWAARALAQVEGLTGPEAERHTAQLTAWYATVLQAEGRSKEALRWAKKAVAQAEAAGDADALGAAYFVMGWASSELNESAEPLFQRSLEAYRQSGNFARQAGLLSNLGVACQWEGRWDDALSYYDQARKESLKIGNTADAELARINIAEILCDRGEVDRAQELLLASLPHWRALRYGFFLGACIQLLGRVALRAGRHSEALGRLGDARTHFAHAGAEQEVLDVDARIAECRAFMRESEAALTLATHTLSRAGTSNSKLVAQLQRVRSYALGQQGDDAGAREALAASLAAGRARRDPFEVAQTLHALAEIDRIAGIEPTREVVGESVSLFANLKVERVPPPPLSRH